MHSDLDIISTILFNIQTDQIRIATLLDTVISPSLRDLLNRQSGILHSIGIQAHCLASQRGWDIREISPWRSFLIRKRICRSLRFRNSDSELAAMMIINYTQAMIRSLQLGGHPKEGISEIEILSQRYLDRISESIGQLKQFL